jgi:hypothetical protein
MGTSFLLSQFSIFRAIIPVYKPSDVLTELAKSRASKVSLRELQIVPKPFPRLNSAATESIDVFDGKEIRTPLGRTTNSSIPNNKHYIGEESGASSVSSVDIERQTRFHYSADIRGVPVGPVFKVSANSKITRMREQVNQYSRLSRPAPPPAPRETVMQYQ